MNKYNPYSVPDNFFATVRQDAMEQRAKTRRRIGFVAGALVLAGMVVATPYLFNERDTEPMIASQSEESMNEMYNSDIFLLVSNF